MRVLRRLLVSGSAAVAAGAMVIAGQAAVTTATAPGHLAALAAHRPPAEFAAQARAALVRYLRNSDPVISLGDPQPGSADQRLSNSAVTSSYNWSGWVDAAQRPGTFTRVSGRWVTPSVTCTREDQLSSAWVGLDGYWDTTVEQAGTVSWCYLGRATYFTWYEMYPGNTVQVGNSLRPGDRVSASVSRTGALYRLSLTDLTRPWNSFSVHKVCPVWKCRATSADWITERPSFAIGVAPLAPYSPLAFTRASQEARGVTGTISGYYPSYKIDMIDATSAYSLSAASPLSPGGASFTTRWLNSY
jgi:hypothetical protein